MKRYLITLLLLIWVISQTQLFSYSGEVIWDTKCFEINNEIRYSNLSPTIIDKIDEIGGRINEKYELKNNLGNLGENKLLLITAVKVMDEYHETKKKVEQKKIELRDLSNRFRELKNLIYDYRDKKEDEIKELNEKHHNLKSDIENNKKNYEKLIDQAADEISNFVDKASSENLS